MGRPRKNTQTDDTLRQQVSGFSDGSRSPRVHTMSQRALDLAMGEAQYFSIPANPAEDLATGMLKLRLSNNVRATFPLFSTEVVGTMAKSFYGIVSGSCEHSQENSFLDQPFRASQSTRVLYELAFKTSRASRKKSAGAVKIAKEAMTGQLWRRFPSEIVSLATAGIPSSYDTNLDEPLFVRLLKEDESTPFAYPPDQPRLEDPLSTLTLGELHYYVAKWFTDSPYGFFLNDTLTLSAITSNTHDRALISIIVGIAISMLRFPPRGDSTESPPSSPPALFSDLAFQEGGLPPSVFEIGGQQPHRLIDPAPFLEYGQEMLFNRPVEQAARSIESVQALLILGAYVGSEHRTRRCWAIMSSGYGIARESLKRIQEMGERERARRTEKQLIEDEQLISVVWMLAIFGSWSFLSLGLPRSTLIDLTDSLPLPPFTHHESLSYTYRQANVPRILPCDTSLKKGIRGFNETCRTLALVVTLSVKNGLTNAAPNLRHTIHQNFEYPRPLEPRAPDAGHFSVMVAKWLVQTAEEHAAPDVVARRRTATSSIGRVAAPSIFLSCVHAIMALHKLAPFDQPSASVVLSPLGLRLSIRAIELLISGSRERVLQSIKDGNGRVLPDTAKQGLLRLLGDALPHCLRLMDHLAESAKTSPEVYSIVFEEQSRIGKLLEDLIFLTDSGITNSGEDSNLGAKRVKYSLAKVQAPVTDAIIPVDHTEAPPSPPKVRVPLPPSMPLVNHYKSLSMDAPSFSPYPINKRNRSGSASSFSVASAGGRSRSGSSSSLLSERPPPSSVQRFGRGRSDSGFESLSVPSPSSYKFHLGNTTSLISEVASASPESQSSGRTSLDSTRNATASSWPYSFPLNPPEWAEGVLTKDSEDHQSSVLDEFASLEGYSRTFAPL